MVKKVMMLCDCSSANDSSSDSYLNATHSTHSTPSWPDLMWTVRSSSGPALWPWPTRIASVTPDSVADMLAVRLRLEYRRSSSLCAREIIGETCGRPLLSVVQPSAVHETRCSSAPGYKRIVEAPPSDLPMSSPESSMTNTTPSTASVPSLSAEN